MTSPEIERRTGLSGAVALKAPVKVATTVNITLVGEQTINGVAVVDGDRVLVKNQTAGADNGIWIASTGDWQRAPDFDDNSDVRRGTQIFVTDGTVNGGLWFTTVATNPVVIGTSAMTFTESNPGPQGDQGDPGAATDITIGTVDTLPPGSPAGASITGTAPNLVLNLELPTGDQGDPGTNGTNGVDGKFSGAEVIETGASRTLLAADVGKTFIANRATAITFNLDPAATLGATWMVIVKNIGAGDLTIDPSGAETINSAASLTLSTGQSAVIASNGSLLRSFFLVPIAASDSVARAMTSTTVFVTPANLAAKTSFRANKNATNQTGIVSGTATKLTFTTEVWDTGGYYDAPNSRFTPPAGKYRIGASALTVGGAVDQAAFGLLLYKNGAQNASRYRSWSGTTNIAADIDVIVDANGTDFFEIYFEGFGAGDKSINGAVTATYFYAEAL